MRERMDSMICSLAALFLAGCGRSDLSDYRPVDKTSSRSGNSIAGGISVPETTDTRDSNPSNEDLSVSALAPLNVVDGASVSMLLKVGPGESASAQNSNAIQPVSATNPAAIPKLRTAELLIPDKTFQRDNTSKALRVSYDDLDLLKVLNLEPVSDDAVDLMPGWLKELNGQRIRIRGFMFPTFEAEGIERFVLARDNQICCFGRDPKVYDLVQVDLRSGKTTNYIPATRAFDVIGKFKIEMVSEDGKPFGLYYIEDAEIIDR